MCSRGWTATTRWWLTTCSWSCGRGAHAVRKESGKTELSRCSVWFRRMSWIRVRLPDEVSFPRHYCFLNSRPLVLRICQSGQPYQHIRSFLFGNVFLFLLFYLQLFDFVHFSTSNIWRSRFLIVTDPLVINKVIGNLSVHHMFQILRWRKTAQRRVTSHKIPIVAC